jgi:hypothetical protein
MFVKDREAYVRQAAGDNAVVYSSVLSVAIKLRGHSGSKWTESKSRVVNQQDRRNLKRE